VGDAAPVGEMVHFSGGLLQQSIDPKLPVRSLRHFRGRIGLGLRVSGRRPVQ
jgi:hypothetical protein